MDKIQTKMDSKLPDENQFKILSKQSYHIASNAVAVNPILAQSKFPQKVGRSRF